MRICLLPSILVLAALSASQVQAQNQSTNRQNTNSSANGSGSQSLQAQGIDAQQAQGGTITGNERFLRENREVGQVIGGTTEGVGLIRGAEVTTTSQAGRGGTNLFGSGRSGFGNLFNQLNQFNANANRNTQRQLRRVPFELGFKPPQLAPPAQLSEQIQTRLDRIPQLRKMGQVSLNLEGQTAVIRGQVENANDRDLVARLVMMEPGVSDVRNELTLAGEPAPPPVLPQ